MKLIVLTQKIKAGLLLLSVGIVSVVAITSMTGNISAATSTIKNVVTPVLTKSFLPISTPKTPFGSNAKYAGQSPSKLRFQILVDTNQILPYEATQASRFAADGVWTLGSTNSPTPGIDWTKTLADLNATKWSVTENDPSHNVTSVDFVSKSMNRPVDGAMFYNEPTIVPVKPSLCPPPNPSTWTYTILCDEQIASDTAHVIPGFGPVGPKIIVLSRGNPMTVLSHAAENPNVSGVVFEFDPVDASRVETEVRCRYVLSLGKKCYFLMPSNRPKTDFLLDFQKAIDYFDQSGGILTSPNVYIVPAVYVRQYNSIHYLSTDPDDHNSMEAIVNWLKAYRNGSTPTPTPTPNPTPSPISPPAKLPAIVNNAVLGTQAQGKTQKQYQTQNSVQNKNVNATKTNSNNNTVNIR